MENKFMLFDKINNIEKEAGYLVTINYQNYDYILYYINNNQNKEVFASKIIVNSEGKNFISDITKEEKSRLSTMAYNIVIATPTEAKNSVNKEELKNNLENKFSIKIKHEMPTLQNQDYFSNCRLAITSDELINNAISFYNEVLKVQENSTPLIENSILAEQNEPEIINIVPENNENVVKEEVPVHQEVVSNIPNPQMQILNVAEEHQNNVPIFINHNADKEDDKKSNDGFVINTSIVIGTIAILLAVIIVTFTFITIKKMII